MGIAIVTVDRFVCWMFLLFVIYPSNALMQRSNNFIDNELMPKGFLKLQVYFFDATSFKSDKVEPVQSWQGRALAIARSWQICNSNLLGLVFISIYLPEVFSTLSRHLCLCEYPSEPSSIEIILV